jgi:hypothetical protein
MAECNWCDSNKWFFQLNRSGLCAECAPTVKADIEAQTQKLRALAEPDAGADWETKVAHYDGVRVQLGVLLRYEGSGIETITPPPSAALVDCGESRAQVILTAATNAVQATLGDATDAATPDARAAAEQLLAEVKNFQDLLGEPLPEYGDNNATVLVKLEKKVQAFLGEEA